MFSWLGRSRRTRQILNEMYGSAQKAKQHRAKKEVNRYLVSTEQKNLMKS